MWRARNIFYAALVHKRKIERYYRQYRKSGSRLCTSTTLRFFLTFRLNTSNSSDALNRYVIISDRWDVVRVFEHPIVQVESSGIVSRKMLYMNTRWMNS